jgi:cytochrome c
MIRAALLATLLAAPAAAAGVSRLEGHGGPVQSLARSPEGDRALTTSFDYAAGLWNLETGALIRWLDGHDAAVTTGAFLPDGDRALTAGDDFDLILWRLSDGAALHRFQGHEGKVQRVAVSADGRLAASAGWDGRIGLWDLAARERLAWLEGHSAGVNDVLFSRDGQALWSAGQDGTVRRWSVPGRAFETVVAEHGFGVNLLALDEARGWLAYGALDGAVRVLDLDSGEPLADVTAGRRPALALALSPDGRLMAVGDGEGFVNVVSTADWETVRDFRATPRGPVWALVFDATGERLLTGGLDPFAQIWPLAEARSVAEDDDLRRPFQRSGLSNGERQFVRKCSICHTLTLDGGRRAGPTLHGVFGREAGAVEGYGYSDALAGSGIVWTAATIGRLFEIGPDHVTPGSKMPMQRIAEARDREDLIDWLRQATAPSEEEDR